MLIEVQVNLDHVYTCICNNIVTLTYIVLNIELLYYVLCLYLTVIILTLILYYDFRRKKGL